MEIQVVMMVLPNGTMDLKPSQQIHVLAHSFPKIISRFGTEMDKVTVLTVPSFRPMLEAITIGVGTVMLVLSGVSSACQVTHPIRTGIRFGFDSCILFDILTV